MKLNTLIFCVLLLSVPCWSQVSSTNFGLSAGKAFRITNGGTNLSGMHISVSAQRAIIKNWISITGRLGSNLMTAPVPEIDNFEKISRGVNLDAELYASLSIHKFRPSFSAGPSIRYGREQNFIWMAVKDGKATTYEYRNVVGLLMGYTIGLGLDYQVRDNISVGGRLAVNEYLNGSHYSAGYSSLAFVMKIKR